MSGGVCDWLELVGQGEGLCIDKRGGCFHEGEPIFIVVPLFKGEAPLREGSHLIESIGLLSERIVHEAQECGGTRHETGADTKTVGWLEQPTLKATV
jgi:hypothetical protein